MIQVQDKYKNTAAIIIAITGLITAVSAFVHKPEETGARAGYLELTKAILDTQDLTKKNQDDLLALHGYLDGYIKSHESIVMSTTQVLTDAGVPKPGVVAKIVSVSAPSSKPPPAPVPTKILMKIKDYDSL